MATSSSKWDDNLRELKAIQERQTRDALLDALFFGQDDSSQISSLLSIHLAGQGRLPVVSDRTKTPASASERIALVLTSEKPDAGRTIMASLLLPLASNAQLKLVSFAAAGRPLSKSVLLGLNALLVNRDNALFDNLPWSTWSVDPERRNYDAAGNLISATFHLGKRDAYNRLMGKDWQGRSLAIGNIALRLKYMMEGDYDDDNPEEISTDEAFFDKEESRKVLATRMLELHIRELRMELADIESQLAVVRTNEGSTIGLDQSRMETLARIASAQDDLTSLLLGPTQASSSIAGIMDRVAGWTTADGSNAAPYRGAMGYAPMLDSRKDINDSLLPYTSPYDLLKKILEDQLNAKVIACVLENASLLKGNWALGGTVVLQRITPTKATTVAGETIKYNDYDEDFGNEGVKAGEIIVVECDSDEAIGVALAHNVPLKVESAIFERAAASVEKSESKEGKSNNIIEFLSMFKAVDSELHFQIEGEGAVSESSNPLSIPRTTTSLFDTIFDEKAKSSPLFPVDNPIKSLGEFDKLTNAAKAKMLLQMSNFSGRLPRPRVLRTSVDNPLDKLLLPLIDESVRRQYYIRDAEARGDVDRAAELRAGKSQRQVAIEQAEKALESGKEDAFTQWDTETEFLESLRADVTQDEGAYSRFLDRDYWYEKDRQATAKRVDRSKFGNLLDGIE